MKYTAIAALFLASNVEAITLREGSTEEATESTAAAVEENDLTDFVSSG